MDKITIERETLERTISALSYDSPPTQLIAALRAALRAEQPVAAQPADTQPTGQSPCARHCEAPAFEGEIRRLKRELQTQAERIRVLRDACDSVGALLDYQYTGSREGMTVLQLVTDKCHAALEATK